MRELNDKSVGVHVYLKFLYAESKLDVRDKRLTQKLKNARKMQCDLNEESKLR